MRPIALSLRSQDTDDSTIAYTENVRAYYSITIEQITIVQHGSIDIRLCGSGFYG